MLWARMRSRARAGCSPLLFTPAVENAAAAAQLRAGAWPRRARTTLAKDLPPGRSSPPACPLPSSRCLNAVSEYRTARKPDGCRDGADGALERREALHWRRVVRWRRGGAGVNGGCGMEEGPQLSSRVWTEAVRAFKYVTDAPQPFRDAAPSLKRPLSARLG
eukprot:365257-Chlamydomonas_euryale.AAC.4